jgi:[acyl-carrier-protein] S-malonyltransferase
MKDIVFLFDGQGAFRPGVGEELYKTYPKAKKIINESSTVLGYDITAHLWGDAAKETSSKTSIAQPAISTISLAYAEVLKNLGFSAVLSLGHSLGEVTALVYCGVVSFRDGIRIINKRGEVMEKGGSQGTMMAVVNIAQEPLAAICKQVSEEVSEPVVIANINAPNQIVISGSKEGIKKAAQLIAKEHGRGIPLKVGGAWHSPYLKNAATEFSGFIDSIDFQSPTSKFYSVVEQKILTDQKEIKDSLKRQMLAQVDWISAIKNIKGLGYETFCEIGPSKILKDLVLKIDMHLKAETTALFSDLSFLVKEF